MRYLRQDRSELVCDIAITAMTKNDGLLIVSKNAGKLLHDQLRSARHFTAIVDIKVQVDKVEIIRQFIIHEFDLPG